MVGTGVFCVVAGVTGLVRLNNVAALFLPFFSVAALDPNVSAVVGVPVLLPTALAIAPNVRDTAFVVPVTGAGSISQTKL